MSKSKRGKSGGSTAVGGGLPRWEQGLLSTQFEEDTWKGNVTFVVPNRYEDVKHIDAFTTAVSSGQRKLFSIITREELFALVRDLGNPKNKKAKEVPPNYEVCEACKPHLDSGEDIPVNLLAKLLKFRLLDIKSKDVKRRETEKKEGKSDEGKGKGDRAKSPKKGGKKTPEPTPAKEGSKLKKRGEEDPDKKYIDDEPDDGPQHYIMVQGFNEASLIASLSDVGVNVDAVIRVSSQDYPRLKPTEAVEGEGEKDEKTLAAEAEAKAARIAVKKELKKFWLELLPILQKQPDTSKLHDVARLEYEVNHMLIPSNLEDADQKMNFGTALFEDLACKIYDLVDARRQYHSYTENLRLINVPECGQPVAPPSDSPAAQGAVLPSATPTMLQNEVDMRYYNDLMSIVPQESVSVPLVMHCMLEQIVASDEDKLPPSAEQPPPRTDGLNDVLANHISGLAFKLALSEDDYNALTEVLELPDRPPESPVHPSLINRGDEITMRTHHLKAKYGFNPEQVERNMLKHLPFSSLGNLPRPSSKIARERCARLQELIHFCSTGGLTPLEIDRAFKQFVLECMDLTSTDPNGFIVTKEGEGANHTPIPWDDPYPYFKGMMTKEDKALYEEELRAALELEKEESTDEVHKTLGATDALIRSSSSCSKGSTPSSSNEEMEKGEKRASRSKKRRSKSGDREGKNRPKSASSEKKVKVAAEPVEEPPEEIPRPPSSSSHKSILRPRSRSGSANRPPSRTNSVHFETAEDGKPIKQPGDEEFEGEEEEPDKTTEESLIAILDAQKRNLNQWCFAEHFEPHVLAQVLREASYTLPFIDTYYHKRDHSLLVVLHNPYNTELQCHVDWHTELHSNLGFRNYLEHVSQSVTGWLAEIEANYAARQLTSELDKLKLDEEAAAKAAEKAAAAKSKKSPRKSGSKSPKSSRPSSEERPQSASENPFLRNQSIKAWKMEQEQLQAEAEELERQKNERKSKSGKKPSKEDERQNSKNSKRPGSRNSSKSKTSQKDSVGNDVQEGTLEEPEPYWPFTGYDVGNNLIHVSGITSSMFPVDGGQIRTQRTEFLQGQTSVDTAVLKDGHVFMVHILNPHEEEEEESDEELREAEKAEELQKQQEARAETEDDETGHKTSEEKAESGEGTVSSVLKEAPKKPAVSGFGSVFAQLNDGMCLAFSTFGASGESEGTDEKEIETDPVLAELTAPSPQPQDPKASTVAKVKKEKGKDKPGTPDPSQEIKEEAEPEKEEEEPGVTQPFQHLYVTCPDGLSVRYFLESSIGVTPASEDDRRLVVRMSYPFKTQGSQPCESVRKKYAMTEKCRTVTTEGSVVKHMVDGTIQVLYSDGTVSTYTAAYSHLPVVTECTTPKPDEMMVDGQPEQPEVESPKKSAKSTVGKASAKSMSTEKSEEAPAEKKPAWVTTLPSGERTLTKEDGESVHIKPVMVCLASDPETKQSMATRDDHVITISYPDGTTIVEHSDGTRITTYYRENQVPVNHEDTAETGEMPQYALQQIKFVKVECLGYATIEFNCDSSENLTVFGNGTTVNVFPDGYYMIHHCDGGRYEVDPEGSSIYYPRPNKYMEQIVPEREIQYVLRHNADVICETVDPDGNVFAVKHNGDCTVTPVESEEIQSELSSVDTPTRTEKKLLSYKQHAPRFFIIHKSGRGTELLRYQDVAEYLDKMEQDPGTAMLQDPLPEFPGANGITVLKPLEGTPCDKWLKKYDMESIMPPGIRSRDLTTLPPKEVKTDGPMFGTNLGKGLCVGAAVKQTSRFPVLKCPDTIEIRQLIQYRPVGEALREKLQGGLKEYAEFVKLRNSTTDLLQVQDPRSEEEKAMAKKLQTLSLEHHPRQPDPADVKAVYEKATVPVSPSPPSTPAPKRSKADWERDQREKLEEQEGRDALRHKKIPPYFDSELGKAFLQTQAKDMDEMMRELSEDLKRETVISDTGVSDVSTPVDLPNADSSRILYANSSRMSNSEIPLPSPPVNSSGKMVDIPESPKGMVTGATPSGLRPGNPTPAHATGQGSPAPLRPKNPTPSHGSRALQDRPGNPTPTKSNLSGGPDVQRDPSNNFYPSIKEHPEEDKTWTPQLPKGDTELILTRSLALDVTGNIRTESIKLPTCIKGGRPAALPNIKYKAVEDPVRRNVRNMMVIGATEKGQGQLKLLRGLNLLPEEVQFGVLKEGYTYAFTVSLKNTGVDSCRFKIRQPPPSTGLRVLYKPGPVAAGMKVDLCIELYAIAVGVEGESGVGSISHNLEIVTETDTMQLPIRAILTAHEYDNRSPDSPRGGKSPGSRLVSTRPPANTGIIRPRKESRREGAIPVF